MDPQDLVAITGWPLQYQTVLVAGYCAYLLASVGTRHSHKAADTIFGTLAFGLPALAVWIFLPGLKPGWAFVLSFAVSISIAVLWRTVIKEAIRRFLKHTGYLWADDSDSAWQWLTQNSNFGPTQLTVELTDGRYLYCSDAHAVRDYPFGPYVLGESGDVLMYVDKSKSGDKVNTIDNVHVDGWGQLVTYVPKEQIRKIAIRHVGQT